MQGHVYDRIEREKNGEKLCITIQQVTPDLSDAVIDHMVEHFLEREPLCSHIKAKNDPVSLASFRELWRIAIQDGAAIVALINNKTSGKSEVIGANVTYISTQSGPPLPKLPGDPYQIALAAFVQITEEANLWEKYKVTSYLSALGLSVHRDYHGIGLGEAILKAREKVCEKFNIEMTETVFTAASSQYIAEKLGFEIVLEYPYRDFNFKLSNVYRDLKGKLSVMIKKYK